MIKLKIDNSYTEIRGMSKECENKVFEKLSFVVEEYNSPYLKIRHLYNRKTKKTYTGLLGYVFEIFDERGEDYEIIDTRVPWKPNANFELVKYLDEEKKIKIAPRPYQKEIIDRATPRECIQAATGAGKTFMMAGLIAKFNVKPVSVFADKIGLCTQLRDEFEKFLGVKVGLVGGGYNEKQDITVYSIQSAKEEDVKDSKLVMVDECLAYDQLVLMADGTKRKIGELVESNSNELVKTFNLETNKMENKRITNHSKIKIGKRKMMSIDIEDTNNKTYNIKCTNNHKIWIKDKGYTRADEIFIDMEVILYGSNRYFKDNSYLTEGKITNIKFIEDEEYVYDITVEDNHNFFCNGILVSNCHHISSTTFVDVMNMCKDAYYRIGVSATPWRDSGDELLIEAMLAKRKPENDVNASKLIDLGYLVPCNINIVTVNGTIKGKNYQKVYNEGIVNNENRNRKIVNIAYNMYKRRNAKTLILIKLVEHGEILLEKIKKVIPQKTFEVEVENKSGKLVKQEVSNIEFLSGKDDLIRRKAVLAAAREGKVDVLIGSTIADEGLDVPALDTLILAGGGRSSTRAFQRIGRVLRLYKGKTRATVFDFDDRTNRMLQNHSKARMKYYRTEPRWNVQSFNVKI